MEQGLAFRDFYMGFLPLHVTSWTCQNVSAAAARHSKKRNPVTRVWGLVPDLALLDRPLKVPGKAQEVCWQEVTGKTSIRSLCLPACDSLEQT